MSAIKIIDLNEKTDENHDCLERVLTTGEVHVKHRGEIYSVQVTRISPSQNGREFLTKSRPIID